jgi:hypothetical protein
MRIELSIDGGFAAIPGLAKPIVLDPANVSSDHGAQLQQLVNAALTENARGESVKAVRVPDARHYRISIQRDGERHELEADDPVVPPAFDALMDFVKANGQR